MEFLEKDLEQIIFESDFETLLDRGLNVSGKKYRQLRIGNYGVSDIVTIQRPFYHSGWNQMCKGTITIYELKKNKIDPSTFFQALRYAKGIQSWLEKNKPRLAGKFDYNLVLVGNSYSGDVCYLSSFFCAYLGENNLLAEPVTSASCYLYNYKVDGISFEEMTDYKLVNEGF